MIRVRPFGLDTCEAFSEAFGVAYQWIRSSKGPSQSPKDPDRYQWIRNSIDTQDERPHTLCLKSRPLPLRERVLESA